MESVRWAFNFKNWKPKKQDWALALSLIQAEEKERINRFVFKKDAKASLVGRLMIRKFVSSKLEIPWSNIILSRSEKGRPYLENSLQAPFTNVDFNVAHQGDWVVLAAELGPNVGVDVMKVEKASNKDTSEFFRLMRRQFTSEEWIDIKSPIDEDGQLSVFYRHWCLKEALVKSIGIGIGFDLQRISFETLTKELKMNEITTDTKVRIDNELMNEWYFEETLVDDSHPIAVGLKWNDSFVKDAYIDKPREKFQHLSFDDLISEAEGLHPVDEISAEAFVNKKETPWE